MLYKDQDRLNKILGIAGFFGEDKEDKLTYTPAKGMTAINKGIPHTIETKRKISKTQSARIRANGGAHNKGVPMKEATKKKISESAKGNTHGFKQGNFFGKENGKNFFPRSNSPRAIYMREWRKKKK